MYAHVLRLTLLLTALAAPSAAAATPDEQLQRSLSRQMRLAPPTSGALVVDLGTGRELYAKRADVPRIPASVEKLYTTVTALLRFGPEHRLATTVLGAGRPDAEGRWDGDLYLRGEGDPTLARGSLVTLASELADRSLIARVGGGILGDERLFDRRRGPPSSGFRLSFDLGAPLGALVVDRGRGRGEPAVLAARALAGALRRRDVPVIGRSARGVAPANAVPLAGVRSADMRRLAQITNRPSDNYVAEMLLKGIGARFGAAGSTAAGAAVVRRSLAAYGIRAKVADGSGLSRANRTSPREVVALLRAMQPAGGAGAAQETTADAFFRSLATAGRNGTLAKRMRGTTAQDRCRGKTGTLLGVSALAGYCDTTGGRRLAFAILMNRVNPYGARRLQDRMAVALARYAP